MLVDEALHRHLVLHRVLQSLLEKQIKAVPIDPSSFLIELLEEVVCHFIDFFCSEGLGAHHFIVGIASPLEGFLVKLLLLTYVLHQSVGCLRWSLALLDRCRVRLKRGASS